VSDHRDLIPFCQFSTTVIGGVALATGEATRNRCPSDDG
jgi:hypothetical protein